MQSLIVEKFGFRAEARRPDSDTASQEPCRVVCSGNHPPPRQAAKDGLGVLRVRGRDVSATDKRKVTLGENYPRVRQYS